MIAETDIPTGYKPRDLQAEIHRKLKRYNVLVCHRRFGKTVLCIMELVDKALRSKAKLPKFGYLAPTFKAARDIAWGYMRDYCESIPGATFYENSCEVRFQHNGAIIRLYGVGDDPDALRGLYWDGIVLDEFALMPARVWTEVVRPGLIDRNGWAIFIGTPMGRNSFCSYYEAATLGWPDAEGKRTKDPEWFGAMYRASETDVLDRVALEGARRQMTQDQYEQEFECSFEAAVPGAVYGVLMREALEEGRITALKPQKGLAVDTWWDLGHSDYTSIWFVQRAGTEIHCVDYYQNHLRDLDHYAEILQRKRDEHGWIYGDHIFPHDGGHIRQGFGGKSLAGMMADLRFEVLVQERPPSIWPGIQRVRQVLPSCWFDAERCIEGIEALRAYRLKEDEKRGTLTHRYFGADPIHDWSSHAADAFRTGVMAVQPELGSAMGELILPADHISEAVI